MLRSKIKTSALICGSAALVLFMAGCDSPTPGDAQVNPGVPTISETSGPASPDSSPPPTSAPTSTSAPTATATQPVPRPQPAETGECQTSDLTLHLGGGDSAAGTTYRSLVFTNAGDRTCTIQGFPGVSYVAGDDGHQVGPAAFRVGTKGPAITLKPGMTAYADIGFVQVLNYDPAVCKPTAVRGLRVYPPHEYDSMFVPMSGTGCAGTPPGNQLTVRTVQPGSGA